MPRVAVYQRRLRERLGLGRFVAVHVRGTDKLPEEEWIAQRLEEKEVLAPAPPPPPASAVGSQAG